MHTLLRGAAVAAVLLLSSLGAAAPAGAETPNPGATYDCLKKLDGYEAPGVCQLLVKADSVCVADAAYVDYALTVIGSPNTRATITWLIPGGSNIVLTDQPLSGRLLWPGVVKAADGTVTDYPGWTKKSDGTWVQGDEFSGTRPSVQMLFEVNPHATVTVAYPGATARCNPPTSIVLAAEDPVPVLSATGSNAAPLLIGGAGLVGLGAVLLLVRAAVQRRNKVTAA